MRSSLRPESSGPAVNSLVAFIEVDCTPERRALTRRGPSGDTSAMSGAARLDGDELFRNPVFLSAIVSLLMAQFIKMVINIFSYRSRSFKEVILTFLWKTGGMPSSHSALVVALATSVALVDGAGSDLFIVSLFFALVVIRDAMGVRRSAGIQARTLNLLGKDLSSRLGIPFRPVKEVQGHSPVQVAVGGLLGFFIAYAICTL